MTRDELLTALREKFPNAWFKPGEEFDERYQKAIWTGEGSTVTHSSGEHSIDFDMFDFHGPLSMYSTFGVHLELYSFLAKHGWEACKYDLATYLIIPRTP